MPSRDVDLFFSGAEVDEPASRAVGMTVSDEAAAAGRALQDRLHAELRRHRFADDDCAGHELASGMSLR